MEATYLANVVSANLRTFQESRSWPERISDVLLDSSLLTPPSARKKIMFDAGIHNGRASLRVIFCDENGGFIRAETQPYCGISDPTYAEALALQAATAFIEEWDITDAIIVGDCLPLIRMIRSMDEPGALYTDLIIDIRSRLLARGLSLPYWTSSDNNIRAHNLARKAKFDLANRVIWEAESSFLLSNDTGRIFQ